MGDPGGPGSIRKCHGVALADLGDAEGFSEDGEEEGDMLFSWLKECTDEKSSHRRKKGR